MGMSDEMLTELAYLHAREAEALIVRWGIVHGETPLPSELHREAERLWCIAAAIQRRVRRTMKPRAAFDAFYRRYLGQYDP